MWFCGATLLEWYIGHGSNTGPFSNPLAIGMQVKTHLLTQKNHYLLQDLSETENSSPTEPEELPPEVQSSQTETKPTIEVLNEAMFMIGMFQLASTFKLILISFWSKWLFLRASAWSGFGSCFQGSHDSSLSALFPMCHTFAPMVRHVMMFPCTVWVIVTWPSWVVLKFSKIVYLDIVWRFLKQTHCHSRAPWTFAGTTSAQQNQSGMAFCLVRIKSVESFKRPRPGIVDISGPSNGIWLHSTNFP